MFHRLLSPDALGVTIRFFLIGIVFGGGPAALATVDVFAAASLTDVMREVAAEFRATETASDRPVPEVRLSFAASSVLARQVEAGAPASILCLANVAWMDRLTKGGVVALDSRSEWLGNTLVLIAPQDSTLAGVAEGLLNRLGESTDRLVLADTAHVPAGIYAQQAITELGYWQRIKANVVQTDNVRSVVKLIERGEGALGITYRTDALATDRVRVVADLPGGSHSPIRYSFARLSDAPESIAFARFLNGKTARVLFRKHGFLVADE